MPDITDIVIWEGKAVLFALFGVVVMRILTGAIRTRGLIAGTT